MEHNYILKGVKKHHLNLLKLDKEIAKVTLERHKKKAQTATARTARRVKEGETLYERFPHVSGFLD